MRALLILALFGLLLSKHTHANSAWEQCSILFTYTQLRGDVKNSAVPERLKEMLTTENKRLVDAMPSDEIADQVRTLTICMQQIDTRIKDSRVEQCFPSFMVFPMAFLFRQRSMNEDAVRSLNPSAMDDKLFDRMIRFVFDRPIPQAGQGLSSKWMGEWMSQCTKS